MMRIISFCFGICLLTFSSISFADDKTDQKWQSLFNGKNLDGWVVLSEYENAEKSKSTDKNQSKSDVQSSSKSKIKAVEIPPNVRVEDGLIVIESITGMDGIKYSRKFPQCDYEICYEAKRVSGSDFFAAMTFPVGKKFCTFVNGGWGGNTIGLSRIDGGDAPDNETYDSYSFNDAEWYKFRIRVTKNKIQVWITGKDGEKKSEEKQVVNLEYKDRKISLRGESEPYQPLGFAAWYCKGNLKNIVWREVK